LHSNWLITTKTKFKLMTRLVLFTPQNFRSGFFMSHPKTYFSQYSQVFWFLLKLFTFPLISSLKYLFFYPDTIFSELYWFLKILLVHLLWLIKYKFCMLIQSVLLNHQVERNWQIIMLTIRLMVDFCFTSPPSSPPWRSPPYVLK